MPYSDPERRRQVQRESARRRRARERASASTLPRRPVDPSRWTRQHGTAGPMPAREPVTCAVDVADVLAEAMELVRRDEAAGSLHRARALAYVASTWLRAHEVGTLADEVADLRRRIDEQDRRRGLGVVR